MNDEATERNQQSDSAADAAALKHAQRFTGRWALYFGGSMSTDTDEIRAHVIAVAELFTFNGRLAQDLDALSMCLIGDSPKHPIELIAQQLRDLAQQLINQTRFAKSHFDQLATPRTVPDTNL